MTRNQPYFVETTLSGYELLNDPLLNKGTAFTESERDLFELHGLLPPHVAELDYQVTRRLDAFRTLTSNLQKYVFCVACRTPTKLYFTRCSPATSKRCCRSSTRRRSVSGASHSVIYFASRVVCFSVFRTRTRSASILAHPRFDHVEAIVVSDGERILGLGDQGAGGMGIPIGKLSLYTACAGLHPSTTLPILIDAGTDNVDLLDDPLYIGWRQERVRGAAYDELIDTFVSAARERWPHVLLHWEDFAIGNANRLLDRYRLQLCSFNDDIQGTAAVAVGTLLSAINVTGVPLTQQRIAVLGAGSAGTGICALLLLAMIEAGLSESEARSRFYLVDRQGLLVDSMGWPAAVSIAFRAAQRPRSRAGNAHNRTASASPTLS